MEDTKQTPDALSAAAPALLQACQIALRLLRKCGQTHETAVGPGLIVDSCDTGLSAPLSAVLASAIAKAGGSRPFAVGNIVPPPTPVVGDGRVVCPLCSTFFTIDMRGGLYSSPDADAVCDGCGDCYDVQ